MKKHVWDDPKQGFAVVVNLMVPNEGFGQPQLWIF